MRRTYIIGPEAPPGTLSSPLGHARPRDASARRRPRADGGSPLRRLLPVGVVAALSAALATAQAGSPELIRPRGWAPLVAVAGGGDARAAVSGLGTGLSTLKAVLEGLEVDAPTRTFIDGLRGSLADFDLEGFHQLLPEEDGPWRRARVCGKVDGRRYLLRAAPSGVSAIDPAGAYGAAPGDLVAEAAARQVVTPERESWLVTLEAGAGVGSVTWDRLGQGAREGLRLLASGDPRAANAEAGARPGTATRLAIVESHPHLRSEDIEVFGVFVEAFPRSAALWLSLGRVEDLVVFDPTGQDPYQQLRVSLRLEPERMAAAFPELAEFLTALGPLVRADLRWRDGQGRTLARAHLESQRLLVTLEAFVADGRLLPVGDDGRVVVGREPAVPAGTFRCTADVGFEVNGVLTELRGLEVDARWARSPDGAEAGVEGRITRAPKVVVTAGPLMSVALWLVDVAIPGNLEELVQEMLTTSTAGDGGRGISMTLRTRRGASGAATVQVGGRLELLDSALVRFGAQVANAKLLPDDETREELWELLRRGRSAFEADLAGFAAVTR